MSLRNKMVSLGCTCAAIGGFACLAPGAAQALCAQPCPVVPPPNVNPPKPAITGTEGSQSLTTHWGGYDNVDTLHASTISVPPVTFTATAPSASIPVQVVASDSLTCSNGETFVTEYFSWFHVGTATQTFQPNLVCPAETFPTQSSQAAQAQLNGITGPTSPGIDFQWTFPVVVPAN